MSSDQSPLFPETVKLLCSCSTDQPNNNTDQQPSSAAKSCTRGRKPSAAAKKNPKNKIPQRGMGVEQLERLRVQEETLHQITAAAAGMFVPPPPTTPSLLHDHHHHHHNHTTPLLGYAAAPSQPNHGCCSLLQYPQPQPQPQPQTQPLIYSNSSNSFGHVLGHHDQGPNFSTRGGGGVTVGSSSAHAAPGWFVPNHHHHHQVNRVGLYGSASPFKGTLVGTPLETSKELSSMPNLHSVAGSQPFAFRLKENVMNEENVRGPNVWRERPNSEPWHNNGDRCYCRDECAEVIAVHRKGNSEVFIEYEFFPGKDGRGTVFKELEFPTIIGSGSVGGEAANSSITTVADYGDTASNSIDLSLKLYH